MSHIYPFYCISLAKSFIGDISQCPVEGCVIYLPGNLDFLHARTCLVLVLRAQDWLNDLPRKLARHAMLCPVMLCHPRWTRDRNQMEFEGSILISRYLDPSILQCPKTSINTSTHYKEIKKPHSLAFGLAGLKIPTFVFSDSVCKIDFGDARFLLCFAFQVVLLCFSHAHDIYADFSLQWGRCCSIGRGGRDGFLGGAWCCVCNFHM